ncbi:unnamed protein product [Eretmochelys imbricata]
MHIKSCCQQSSIPQHTDPVLREETVPSTASPTLLPEAAQVFLGSLPMIFLSHDSGISAPLLNVCRVHEDEEEKEGFNIGAALSMCTCDHCLRKMGLQMCFVMSSGSRSKKI